MRRKQQFWSILICIIALMIGICLYVKPRILGGQVTKESKLPTQEQDGMENSGVIRVLLKTNGFKEVVHVNVELSASSGLELVCGDVISECEAGKSVVITPDDSRFKTGKIRVRAKKEGEKIIVSSLKRGYGTPAYRGSLELFQTAEGVAIVNELPLEEYLYAVVPSEMPASYELEALKAQAVCARSYAYNQSRTYAYPEYFAHVDDSTSFQVYGNSQEQESTIRAVRETSGEKLWYGGQVATAYYYSTSCGTTASITAWGDELTDINGYLRSVELSKEDGLDYEAALPWYRWTATISEQLMSDLIEINTKTELGSLVTLEVTKVGDGGIVQEITAKGTAGQVSVETENKIRRALGGEGYVIEKQDGSMIKSRELLPSAFFRIEKENGCYILRGGGYGHGIGMSQNGANEMAKCGKKYHEILASFYTGVTIG